jgi:probable rRNA maturation factor
MRAPGLSAWLARVAPRTARGDVAVALVSDARIRELNRRFRGKDTPTDVLSFADEGAQRTTRSVPRIPNAPRASRLAPRFLGDIVISTMTARRQARDTGHSYASELKVLALHGLLHLLGYDHDHPTDGGRMARLERRLRAQGGLRAGLIERAPAAGPASTEQRAPAARARQRSAGGNGAQRPAAPKLARSARAKAGAGGGAPASTEQ